MKEISQKINDDIQQQAERRGKNNELILKLIEGACQRLEEKMMH